MNNDKIQQLIKEGKISMKTIERTNIAKSYIEKKYSIKKVKEEEKKKDWDYFLQKLDELNLSSKEKELIKKDALHKEAEYLRIKRKKKTIREFESITIIGRGAFGEVRVCRHMETGDIVAIKKMRKEDMLSKNQIMHVRTEKEILTTANNPWIVNLRYSFQDDYYLYLVMDFLPGGDLMSLLMRKDILTEDEARFYTAELILAVESVHNLNCIHRDLKPDNILIDKNGHIRLSDFGLSKLADQTFYPMSNELNKVDEVTVHKPGSNVISENKLTPQEIKSKRKNRLIAFSTVGTPDYIAPEVFGQHGYGQEVDWWSVGVILFEMLVGYPPFFSENPSDTCQKIIKWKQHFSIPLEANLSLQAETLIRKMVTVPDHRLGVAGVEEIKKHPFFDGIDWDNIREMKAPYIPDIKNDWDTKYFDRYPEQEPFYPSDKKQKKRKDINYAGYTFNRDIENQRGGLLHALEVLEAVKLSTQNIDEKYDIVDDIETDTKEKKTSSQDLNNDNKVFTQPVQEVSSIGYRTEIAQTEVVNIASKNRIPFKGNIHQVSKSPDNKSAISLQKTGKGLNIIPVKNLSSHREGCGAYVPICPPNDRDRPDRFSPKPKDLKIGAMNLSPKGRYAPLSNKNQQIPSSVQNKVNVNISTTSKSPSPMHTDSTPRKKTNESKK